MKTPEEIAETVVSGYAVGAKLTERIAKAIREERQSVVGGVLGFSSGDPVAVQQISEPLVASLSGIDAGYGVGPQRLPGESTNPPDREKDVSKAALSQPEIDTLRARVKALEEGLRELDGFAIYSRNGRIVRALLADKKEGG